jgi:hypothetical protein
MRFLRQVQFALTSVTHSGSKKNYNTRDKDSTHVLRRHLEEDDEARAFRIRKIISKIACV